jgi:hypothetical protein
MTRRLAVRLYWMWRNGWEYLQSVEFGARAYAVQGDTAKSRAAYQDFLNIWKDADADIPILRRAKAEYAKLQ